MVNIDTIEREILTLESRDTTYANIERLAWLYIVRDHLLTPEGDEMTGNLYGSEFCAACSNVPLSSLMSILSEHMEAVAAIYPKEYASVLARIKSL